MFLVFLLLLLSRPLLAKNVFEQILGAYQKYQEINMTLWLAGDVGAEKRFGKELQMWMGLTYKEEKNPAVKNYVKSIFDRLVPQFNNRGMKFDVRVIRNNTANAFVIPGGHVYVFTGLLDLVQSDDELAAVISHELAHAERRHSLQNFRASTIAVALLERAVKNKKDRETWGALLSYLTLMKFSRQQEDEADDIGQFRMARAGFNPAAQVSLWEKFLRKFGDSKGLEQYLSSHPPSSDRVENARKNLAKMNVSEQTAFSNTRNILAAEKINLLKNPSFELEREADGRVPAWEATEGVCAIAENLGVTGRRSLQLSSLQRLNVTRVLSDFIPVDQASDFVVSGWCRSETGNQSAAVGVELYDASRRLRNRLWTVRAASVVPASWTYFEARLANTGENRIFAANTAFARIVLQAGLSEVGSVWFDELRIKPAAAIDPVNLVAGGDFETVDANGAIYGVIANASLVSADKTKSNTGYSSLLLRQTGPGDAGFAFAPIPLSSLKPGQKLNGSFYFHADRQQKGLIIAELVDASGNPLPRRLAQVEFEAGTAGWQATSFSFNLDLQNDEATRAVGLQIKMAAGFSDSTSMWFDTFIMR
jgi:Zn-dependent protease with chaperone function